MLSSQQVSTRVWTHCQSASNLRRNCMTQVGQAGAQGCGAAQQERQPVQAPVPVITLVGEPAPQMQGFLKASHCSCCACSLPFYRPRMPGPPQSLMQMYMPSAMADDTTACSSACPAADTRASQKHVTLLCGRLGEARTGHMPARIGRQMWRPLPLLPLPASSLLPSCSRGTARAVQNRMQTIVSRRV